jgi:peptidoglycan/LPS O-acetylase OafA/YrhL
MKKRLPYFPDLAGLRGLMAAYVCLVHFLETSRPATQTTNPLVRLLLFIAAHQYITIDAFFVLSGFLITSLLLRDREKPHYFNNFYWRRALRILPVFLIGVAMFRYVVPHSDKYILLCFLLIANFSSRFGVQISSGVWTLCIEEQFYLLWPQAVRRCTTATIAWIAVGLILFSNLARPLVFAFHHGAISDWYTFYRVDGLGFGALAACGYMAPEELSRTLRRILDVLTGRTLFYVGMGCFFIVPFLHIDRYQEFASISLTSFLTFRLIYSMTKGRSYKLLLWRPLVVMGAISYAFYLYQGFFIYYVIERYGAPDPAHAWRFLERGVLVFAMAAGVSILSLFLVEKPAQRLRRYVLKRPAEPQESFATQIFPETKYQPET